MPEKKKSSWKTSVGGILIGVGTPMAAAGEGIFMIVGAALVSIGGILLGVSARDSSVSSEDAGVK